MAKIQTKTTAALNTVSLSVVIIYVDFVTCPSGTFMSRPVASRSADNARHDKVTNLTGKPWSDVRS
jgi:hypothetical protein